LYVHSAPSALCPHVEWAAGGVFGMPIHLDWTPQQIERASYRADITTLIQRDFYAGCAQAIRDALE